MSQRRTNICVVETVQTTRTSQHKPLYVKDVVNVLFVDGNLIVCSAVIMGKFDEGSLFMLTD
ncbi:hypothetical protein E2C01_085396 [Portunus trituberculatus]|uniref:Uncharacterized protein n=1 Tax=Portunus trituberculatus TaxID=210409 RepID=A0A5B7J6M8_PORTR|nr:hypothetical protein [Portunus trituberculatus]